MSREMKSIIALYILVMILLVGSIVCFTHLSWFVPIHIHKLPNECAPGFPYGSDFCGSKGE